MNQLKKKEQKPAGNLWDMMWVHQHKLHITDTVSYSVNVKWKPFQFIALMTTINVHSPLKIQGLLTFQ